VAKYGEQGRVFRYAKGGAGQGHRKHVKLSGSYQVLAHTFADKSHASTRVYLTIHTIILAYGGQFAKFGKYGRCVDLSTGTYYKF